MNLKTKSGNDSRMTFREIVDETRTEAAGRAWDRARLASRIRHAIRDSGRIRGTYALGELKRAAISRAIELAPDRILVSIDTDFHVGLLSIRWNGHGGLHLPAATEFPASYGMQAKRSA